VFVVNATRGSIALDVRSLTIRYGAVLAVDSVSFTARHGEVTAVLGRNGAGKTSTIEACEGLRPVNGGSVSVLGADARRLPAAVRARMGVMLQDGGIAPAARVRSTVRHYCE
jgi:ABC-2 type transport system ATP-binding protein